VQTDENVSNHNYAKPEKERGEEEWGWLFQSDERTLYRLRKKLFVLFCLKRCLKYFSKLHESHQCEIPLTEKSHDK
jgi:hypothetical protein